MKKVVFFICLLLVTVDFYSQQVNYFELTGPYLGQKLPGTVPEIFASGIVSTSEHEFSCCFSPDGKEFYFTRKQPDTGAPAIMWCRLVDGVWSEPEVIPFAENENTFEPWVTLDNERLYYQAGKFIPGQKDGPPMNIFYVEREGDNWGIPKNEGAPFNPATAMRISSTLDGTIYTTDITGGPGTETIAFTKKVNREYKELVRLDPPINSDKQDMYPYIAPDESYLIFTSRRSTGNAGRNLLISFRNQDGTWGDPKVIELGMDAGLPLISPDGKYLFFTGGERGKSDIFWVDAKVALELRDTQ